ncbi:MAG: cyclic nucleotide-binding domain-containing protein [Spirochaetales bacterium]|nr:cyclic nucleotide-binding domain-containing protein [Spirochaetales bacterium]
MKVSKSDIINRLKQIPFFEEIKQNTAYMEILYKIIKFKGIPGGSSIIREGEMGSEMYILYSGSVDVRKKTREGDDYTVVVLESSQNVFFGEMALIDDDKRSATVIAKEECVLMIITKSDFLELSNAYPQICLPIMRAISKKLASYLRKTTQDVLYLFDALVEEIKNQ